MDFTLDLIWTFLKKWQNIPSTIFVLFSRFTHADVAMYSTNEISPSSKLEDLQDQLFHVRNQLLDPCFKVSRAF